MNFRGERGKGSLDQAPNGKWWIRVSATAPNGRRIRRRLGPYKTKHEAMAAQDALVPLTPSATITVNEWMDRWLSDRSQDLIARGREARAAELAQHNRDWISPALGKKYLVDLTPAQCDVAWRSILSAGRKVKTARNVRGTLSQALDRAVRDGHITRNAARQSEIVAEHAAASDTDSIVEIILAPSQLKALTDWCVENLLTHRWAMPTLLALDTGGRRGEILAVTWDSISFENRTITFRNQVTNVRVDGKWTRQIRVQKTAESRRTISIPQHTIEALRRFETTWDSQGSVYLFHRNGELPRPNSWSDWVREQVPKIVGRDKYTLHGFRHTHASYLLAAGVPVPKVSARLGHSTILTTLKDYAHAIPSNDGDVSDAWAKILGTGSKG